MTSGHEGTIDGRRPGSRAAVLVVEDEIVTRLNAIDMVEAAGFEAIGAANADDAIGELERRGDIRLVFTDIQMPGSMDGLGLVRLVRERWPCVAALVASGRSSVAPEDLPTGVTFLAKPYVLPQIEAALRALIR